MPGDGGDDDVEGVGGVAAVGGGVGEGPGDLIHLEVGAGPAVDEQQRERVGALAGKMGEVKAEAVDLGAEAGQALVQHAFLNAPVVGAAPVLDQLADVGERRAVVPAYVRELVGKADAVEAAAQVVENAVGDVDGPRGERHGRLRAGVCADSMRRGAGGQRGALAPLRRARQHVAVGLDDSVGQLAVPERITAYGEGCRRRFT